MNESATSESAGGVELRSNWWHVVAGTALYFPIAVVSILTLGANPYVYLFQFAFALLYPVALRGDVKYVRAVSDWQPSLRTWTLIGVVVTLSLGLLSVIVSPYYLYRRRAATRGVE